MRYYLMMDLTDVHLPKEFPSEKVCVEALAKIFDIVEVDTDQVSVYVSPDDERIIGVADEDPLEDGKVLVVTYMP